MMNAFNIYYKTQFRIFWFNHTLVSGESNNKEVSESLDCQLIVCVALERDERADKRDTGLVSLVWKGDMGMVVSKATKHSSQNPKKCLTFENQSSKQNHLPPVHSGMNKEVDQNPVHYVPKGKNPIMLSLSKYMMLQNISTLQVLSPHQYIQRSVLQ